MSESNGQDIDTKANNAIVALVDFFSALHARDTARVAGSAAALNQTAVHIKQLGEELARRERRVGEMQGVFAAAMGFVDHDGPISKQASAFDQVLSEVIEEVKKVKANRAG